MQPRLLGFLIVASLISGICTATDAPVGTAPETDQERIDSLIIQNKLLVELVSTLKVESERPKSREEVFAACMQAAKGSSAMAAESIGTHCNQLLKK